MKLSFEYGNGTMDALLPDSTDIFVPGETVPDPPCLPQDWDTLYPVSYTHLDVYKRQMYSSGIFLIRRPYSIFSCVVSQEKAEGS